MFKLAVLWLSFAAVAFAQNPQTQTAPPFAANAKYTNGVAPGYAPTAGAGLVLNVGPGTANCSGTMITYSGGTLSMTASVTNYVYLNTASSCAVASKTSTFTSTDIPIAIVVASGSAITGITDDRTPFMVPGAGAGMVYPSAGIARSTGSAWTTPAAFADITALWAGGSCSGFLKNDGTCSSSPGIPYPSAGIVRSTGSGWTTPATFAEIAALWASGTCVGFLKNDGTCAAVGSAGITTINGNTGANQTLESTDNSVLISAPDNTHINFVGTGLQYNPPTTAYVIAGASVLADDSHVTSSALPVSTYLCNGTICTVNFTSAHGLITGDWGQFDKMTGWFATPNLGSFTGSDTGYGTFQITKTSSTQVTFPYTFNTGSCASTCGNAYNANFWAVYAASREPYLKGHGSTYYRFGACADLDTNFAANFGGITGTPKYLILECGQDEIANSTDANAANIAIRASLQSIWTKAHAAGWIVMQGSILPTQYGFAPCATGSPSVCTIATQLINEWLPTQVESYDALSGGAYYDQPIDFDQTNFGYPAIIAGVGNVGGKRFGLEVNEAFLSQAGRLSMFPYVFQWDADGGGTYDFMQSPSRSGLKMLDLGHHTFASFISGQVSFHNLNLDWLTGGGTQFLAVDNSGNVGTGVPPTGLSGGTSGQVPIMNSATTANASKPVAGSGNGLASGPTSGTATDQIVTYNGTGGETKTSGILITAIPAADIASGALASGMTATTQAPGTNNTTLATMAAVQAAIAAAGTGAGIVTYSGPALAFTGTQYFPIGGGATASGTEANVNIDSPAAVTIQNMTVQLSAAPGGGNSIVFTWRKNGADTALTCTISGGSATSCSDTTHNFSTASLDLLDIKAVTTGTVAGTPTVVMAAQVGVAAAATGVTSVTAADSTVAIPTTTGAVTVKVDLTHANTWTGQQSFATPSANDNSTKAATTAYVDGKLVASGTAAMGTSAISSGACATVVTVGASGVATTDVIQFTPNADPTGVTGYAVSASGSLYIWPYPTANNVNFKVCNNTSGSLTPSALTLNWRVAR